MGGLSHTVSGDIASFRTPSRVPIENLKFHFLPKQAEGTPTPENPIPIEGWTGVNGLQLCKNLIQFTAKTSESYGVKWIEYSDGVVEYEGTPTSWSSITLGTVKLNGITKVYGKIFGDESNVSFNTLYIYDANGTRLGQIGAPWENTTHDDTYVTVDLSSYPTADYIDIRLKRANNNIPMKGKCYAVVTDNLDYLRIPITFQDGETIYGGYVDPIKGEIWRTHASIRADDYAWEVVEGGDNPNACVYRTTGTIYIPFIGWQYGGYIDAKSNALKPATYTATFAGEDINTFWWNNGSSGFRCVWGGRSPNIEGLMEFLTNNNVIFCGKLSTPVLVATFDPITLQAFLDHNNFWSDANDITEVTYAVTESKDILATRKKAMDFDIGHHKKVQWNQIQIDGNFQDRDKWAESNYGSISNADGIMTWTCHTQPTQFYHTGFYIKESTGFVAIPYNHKIIITADIRCSVSTRVRLYGLVSTYGNTYIYSYLNGNANIPANEWTHLIGFISDRPETPPSSATDTIIKRFKPTMQGTSGDISTITVGTTMEVKNFMAFDLTQMFGLGNEPQTVAEFEHICEINGIDLTTYQPYDTGSDRWLIVP